MPGKYDLNLYRGDYYSWRFRLWEDEERTQPTDLTDAVAEAEIRDRPNGAAVVHLDCQITLPNIVDMRFAASKWDCLLVPTGVWDLEITFPGEVVKTELAGQVTVTADVTNSKTSSATANGVRSIR